VIPLFKRQIAAGGPVTLTDPRMTRFIMTLEEACRLVMDSVFLGYGGEVFVTKMPVVRIEDLAQAMIEELAPRHGRDPRQIEIELIGPKPGEKMYEELMSSEEVRRAVELPAYFAILPAFLPTGRSIVYDYPNAVRDRPVDVYTSASSPAMSREELRRYLREHGFLEPGG